MVYKYECNAMRKGSSVCHIPVSSSQPTQRAVSVCVCRGAQLFFYLGAKERERKVSRLLTWPLIAGTNTNCAIFKKGIVKRLDHCVPDPCRIL